MTGRRLLASLVALCAAATGLYNQYGLLRPEIISDAYLKADEAKCLRGAEHTPTREDNMTTEKPLAAVMDANKCVLVESNCSISGSATPEAVSA